MQEFIIKFLYFVIPLVASVLITSYTKKFLDRRQRLIAYYRHTTVGKVINRGADLNIWYHPSIGLEDEKPPNQNFHIVYVTDSMDAKKQWYFIGKNAAQEEVRGYINDLTDKYSLLTRVTDFLREKTYSNINNDSDRLLLRDKLLSSFGIPLSTQNIIRVFTHSLTIKNSSNYIAHNVRIGHLVPQPINNIADCISVYPPENYQIREIDEYQEIVFSSLAPKTEITITYTYLPPVTRDSFYTYVKSDEGYAKIVDVILNKQYPKLVYAVIWIFLVIGVASTIYAGIKFLELFIRISNVCQ